MAILLTYLYEQPGKRASYKSVLRANWQHFDKPMLTETIVPTLEGAGYITEIVYDNEGGLQLTEKGIEKFESKMR
jgi:hypothetical protein